MSGVTAQGVTTGPGRADVKITTPDGERIDAWLYRPDNPVRGVLVMAMGIGGVKAAARCRLSPSTFDPRGSLRSCSTTVTGATPVAARATCCWWAASSRTTGPSCGGCVHTTSSATPPGSRGAHPSGTCTLSLRRRPSPTWPGLLRSVPSWTGSPPPAVAWTCAGGAA